MDTKRVKEMRIEFVDEIRYELCSIMPKQKRDAFKKKADKMRARSKGNHDSTLSKEILWLVSLANKCCYCAKEGRMTIEHLTPLSRGGIHSIHNVAPACVECNHKKDRQTLIEFIITEKYESRKFANW